MKKSTLSRVAIGVAGAAVVLGGAVQAASAATSPVTSVSIAPNAVRFDYVLSATSPRTNTLPSLRLPGRTCGNGTFDFIDEYETVSFSVSQSGSYLMSGSRTGELPAQYASGVNDVDQPGFGYIYPASSVTGSLDDTCIGSGGSDGPAGAERSFPLEQGRTYTLALLASNHQDLGRLSLALSGPGRISVVGAELTREDALALCAPGTDVPAGYTLREGSARSETLTGTSGNDVVRGLGGNDTIRGLGGDDVLCGGDGQDTVDGGDGADFVFGEVGQDTLSGGTGDDVVDGGDGQDSLNGNAGDDGLFGGAGTDVLDGGAGADEGTDTDPRTIFRNVETVNGPAPTPTRTTSGR